MSKNVNIKLNRKTLVIIITSIILISITIFSAIFLSLRKDTEMYNTNKNSSNNYTDSINSSNRDSNKFNSLEISNIHMSSTKYRGWKSVVGQVKNNSNETLYGYLEVSFYSRDGELVDVVSASLAPISPGQIGTFETPGTKQEAYSCKVLNGNILVKSEY